MTRVRQKLIVFEAYDVSPPVLQQKPGAASPKVLNATRYIVVIWSSVGTQRHIRWTMPLLQSQCQKFGLNPLKSASVKQYRATRSAARIASADAREDPRCPSKTHDEQKIPQR